MSIILIVLIFALLGLKFIFKNNVSDISVLSLIAFFGIIWIAQKTIIKSIWHFNFTLYFLWAVLALVLIEKSFSADIVTSSIELVVL